MIAAAGTAKVKGIVSAQSVLGGLNSLTDIGTTLLGPNVNFTKPESSVPALARDFQLTQTAYTVEAGKLTLRRRSTAPCSSARVSRTLASQLGCDRGRRPQTSGCWPVKLATA